ncbi:MAG: RluA family pseudouridine synthase [Lachnospiraceae bacterium]|nr:RluA family pseudouridine synthase [Lachnospiraceae bacterium]
MKEYTIGINEAGQRMDKYCARILKDAPVSFLYKMFRKKNITLNGKKAKGNEILQEEDQIRFFLSDETFASFAKNTGQGSVHKEKAGADGKAGVRAVMPPVVYEDENLLLVNKPVGILSQKSDGGSISLNEICLQYLKDTLAYKPDDPAAFKPSVVNRLDRNTSGLLMVAKTHAAAMQLSEGLRNKTIRKQYVCIVKGVLSGPFSLKGYLIKDPKSNTVSILQDKEPGSTAVETDFMPVRNNGELTLLQVELKTGKPHQIRAHLHSIGHPILGDPKYGDLSLNRRYGCKTQLLHAYRLEMPAFERPLTALSHKVFEIPYPKQFEKYM